MTDRDIEPYTLSEEEAEDRSDREESEAENKYQSNKED
jgi:hypothetical protein